MNCIMIIGKGHRSSRRTFVKWILLVPKLLPLMTPHDELGCRADLVGTELLIQQVQACRQHPSHGQLQRHV